MKRGTVVLALLPFTDLTDRKRRPALVVSPETRQGDDLLVAFITSYRGEILAPTDLLLTEADPDFTGTGLKRTSIVKLDKLFTLHKDLIIGRLGQLRSSSMTAVNERLQRALGLL